MKVFNTVLSLILLIAVIILFFEVYDVYDKKEQATNAKVEQELQDTDFKGARIAYINTDSLVEQYDYHKELREKLEAKAKKLEADLAGKSKAFEENYTTLQKQAETMNPDQLQAAQLDLQRTQQELLRYRDERASELAKEEQELNTLIMEDMATVLDDIKAEHNLDYILSFDPNSILLSANKDYNITALVAQRLNTKHKSKQEGTENNEK